MNKYKVYRPNLSDYKIVEGTHISVLPEGKTQIWNVHVLVASIPNNLSVILDKQ